MLHAVIITLARYEEVNVTCQRSDPIPAKAIALWHHRNHRLRSDLKTGKLINTDPRIHPRAYKY